MTTPHRTLQMALDALDAITDDVDGTGLNTMPSFDKALDAIAALREALNAPEPEPVAEVYRARYGRRARYIGVDDVRKLDGVALPPLGTKLYAAPPAAPAPVPDGMETNADEVICPNCAHQFRAIPENVQSLLLASGHEPPFTASPAAPAAPVPAGWVMVPREPTPEMIAAYLAANTQYWAEVDALPRTPVTKWRQGTPSDATRESYRAMIAASPAAPVVPEPVIDEMDAIASKYAHKLALDLECVLLDYHGKWWNTAMQTLGEYRSAMNAIHERESPTHMGEPVLPGKNCDRPDCPAGGYGPCAPCEREHSGG